MGNIEKYYDNTKDAMPNYTVQKFIELNIKPGMQLKLVVEQEEIQYF